MAVKESTKSEAWVYFDHIVAQAAPKGQHTNPWIRTAQGELCFVPDFETLQLLLGVPLYLKAGTQSGVPALALDVWLSYELRRAGFTEHQVWPRPQHPRIVPSAVSTLINSLPAKLRKLVLDRVESSSSIKGVTSSAGIILGKNYTKQVDVIITDWATGPELLVSTKRMDSSYGKNAANRVEESYGDAKNLRLRYPLAALGFVFGLRSDILQKEPKKAEWLFDLLAKLGQEDDAYHATCLVLMEYPDSAAVPDGDAEADDGEPFKPGPEEEKDDSSLPATIPATAVDTAIAQFPKVLILHERTPDNLAPARFLSAMVSRILAATPVDMHEVARARRKSAIGEVSAKISTPPPLSD